MNPIEKPLDRLVPGGWNPGMVLTFFACMFGGFAGGFVVHQMHPMFAYEELPVLELGSPPELVQKHHDAALAYRTRNYAMEFAVIGMAFGLSIGAISRGKRWMLCIFGGAVAGALTGFILGFASGSYITQTLLVNAQQTLQSSMGIQTLVWGGVLANTIWVIASMKVGMVGAFKYWIVGLLAGFAVAAIQFVVSSIVFPNSNPIFLVPEQSGERIYWLAAFPVVAGLAMALGLSRLNLNQSKLSPET